MQERINVATEIQAHGAPKCCLMSLSVAQAGHYAETDGELLHEDTGLGSE